MQKTITIIGATGHLGRQVARKLDHKGVKVTAIVRDVISARTILPESIQLIEADVSDKENLVSALVGTKTLYITLNTTSLDPTLPFHSEREGVINIVEAAKINGVQHIMQIAGIDYLHPEFAGKGLEYKTNVIRKPGIEAISNSGINFTFFFCSFFLDSFPTFIENDQFSIIGDHVHPIYYTNTTDLAEMIGNAIGNEMAYNQSFSVQGTEGMSLPEAARTFVEAYSPGTEIAVHPIAAIAEMGLPEEQAVFMEHMLTYVEQLKEQPVSQKTWQVLGKPDTTITDFARDLSNAS
ncbi:SDR family oxidoreductase [Microbulbifer sp. EKSA005]|uniref:SDR family oxidoreductase n=1 Tax=Microbulbifer sp. EKSA005 TaxID=3243364 RepID=UPI0040429B06